MQTLYAKCNKLLLFVHRSAEKEKLTVVLDLWYTKSSSQRECNSIAKQISCFYGKMKHFQGILHLSMCSYKGGCMEMACAKQGMAKWLDVEKSSDDLNEWIGGRNKQVIYLTPDSNNVLEKVDDRVIYVIGGIADKSVRKNESLHRANVYQYTTARLPVKEYLHTKSTTVVLNIDSVLGILVDMYRDGNWKTALERNIPKRVKSKANG